MLDKDFSVKLWHVLAYNITLIVGVTTVVVKIQGNVEQLTTLTNRMETRLTNVEAAQHALEVKLPVMDNKLDYIRGDIAELKTELRKRP